MKRVSIVASVTVALVLGHLQLLAAQTAKFRYVASVYFDAKGVGLNVPEAVACGTKGQIVIGDTGNDRLLRFTYQDKAVSGGSEIKIPEVAAPVRVQLNSKGEIYALDALQRRIVRLGADGAFKNAFAFDGVPAPASVMPKSFAIDSADNIYVLDVLGARVLALNGEGRFQRAVAFPPEIGFGSEIAVDAAGNILLLDSIKRRLFSAAKDATTFSALGGDLSEVVATMPTYLAATRDGIFIVEGSGSSIVGLGRDGAFLTRQLALGSSEGAVNHPSQLCVNDRNEVFIADTGNSRIQVFQLIR